MSNSFLGIIMHVLVQGAIITSLQNRFKEFRRDRKVRRETTEETSVSTETRKKPATVQQSPSKCWMQAPAIPDGEDEFSFNRFSSQLREEAKRRNPREEVVQPLMATTFAQRRRDILNFPAAIHDTLQKYPFLSNQDEVLFDTYLLPQ